MNVVAPPAGQVAFDTVRRLLAEAGAGTRAPAPVAALASGDDGHGTDAALGQRLAGRTVPATVVARLAADTGIVDIGGRHVNVEARLPAAGQTVMLRFAATPETATGRVAAAPGLPAGAAAPLPAGTAQVSLGALAQTLSEVARTPLAPLDLGRIAAPLADTQAFARELADHVRDSGAFYESHLERWSRGEYPLEAIRREPQAAADARAPRTPAEPATAPPASAGAAAAAASAGIDGSSQVIMREQLDLIENRCLSVAFTAWPGQDARLEIVDERETRGQSAAETAWSTRIALTLPHLGHVEARLGLTGERLQVVVRTTDATALEQRRALLAEGLARAGIVLSTLRIDHDPDA